MGKKNTRLKSKALVLLPVILDMLEKVFTKRKKKKEKKKLKASYVNEEKLKCSIEKRLDNVEVQSLK